VNVWDGDALMLQLFVVLFPASPNRSVHLLPALALDVALAVLEASEEDAAHGTISCSGVGCYFELEWAGRLPDAARYEWPRKMMFPASAPARAAPAGST